MTITPSSPFLPRLSGAALDVVKIIAALCMVGDHVNSICLHDSMPFLALAGRLTFPLFCYAAAISLDRAVSTEQKFHYITRLFMWALIAEPVSILVRNEGMMNVLFTLGLGSIFALYAPRFSDKIIFVISFFALFTVALPQTTEFSFIGILLPYAFLRVIQGDRLYLGLLSALLFMVNQNMHPVRESTLAFEFALLGRLLIGGVTVFGPYIILRLAADGSQTGKRLLPKYFLHVFYPSHLFVLWVVQLLLK